MKAGKVNRGSQPAIGPALWSELQHLERDGKSLREMMAWLAEKHDIKVSEPTMSRAMAKIRAAAPPPGPPPLPDLEPATDDDELRLLRAHFWTQARDRSIAPKDQQGAARLLLSIRAEKRAGRPLPLPGQQTAAPTMPVAEAAPAMTPEQEAAAVRAHLHKSN